MCNSFDFGDLSAIEKAEYLRDMDERDKVWQRRVAERESMAIERAERRAVSRSRERAAQRERSRKRKQFLVDYKGGVCEICGKEYPVCVFDFHHVRGQKQYNISARMGAMKDADFPDKILYEINKCRLLCSNCHRIIHWEDNQSTG